MIPTTDQMDHTTPEERHDLAGLCDTCGETIRFHALTGSRSCKCGGKVLQSSVRSWRTWNSEMAKKEKAKILKGGKK